MGTRITQQLSFGVGAAGALVEVTSKLKLESATEYETGPDDEFSDTPPGSLKFRVENDGRFTNLSSAIAAGYSSVLAKGASVCWIRGGVPVAAKVLAAEPVYRDGQASWAELDVSCDDGLGAAARIRVDDPAATLISSMSPYLWWPMTDSAPAATGLVAATAATPPIMPGTGGGPFSYPGVPGIAETQILFRSIARHYTDTTPANPLDGPVIGQLPTLAYTSTSLGTWSAVWTPAANAYLQIVYGKYTGAPTIYVRVAADSTGKLTAILSNTAGGALVTSSAFSPLESHVIGAAVRQTFSGGTTTFAAMLYLDGAAVGTWTTITSYVGALASNEAASPTNVGVVAAGDGWSMLSHLSLVPGTVPPPLETLLPGVSVATRLRGIAALAPTITLDTPPAALSSSPLGGSSFGGSVLDELNLAMATEQGYLYAVTTATDVTTNVVEKITVRERSRPTTVSATFNVEDECSDVPDFIKELTNLVYQVTTSGPTDSVTWTDSTIARSAGNTSADTLLRDAVDLQAWGQDRIARGSNDNLRAPVFWVDAMTTPTDRVAALLNRVPGDRVSFTGLPPNLGVTSCDAYVLGRVEKHDLWSSKIGLKVAPVLPTAGVFDTDRFTASGVLTLSAGINAAVTSLSIATSDPVTVFTTAGGDLPLTIRIDDECLSVTACTSATPQVATVTRGAVDPVTGAPTTAATHSAGATIELASAAVVAF